MILIKEIVEKHFENMVDDVLAHTETYYDALGAVGCIKGSNIADMGQLADCLRKLSENVLCNKKHLITKIRC